MKGYIFLPVVLLGGLVIGGLGTRIELNAAKAEIEDLKKQAAKAGKMSPGKDFSGVTRLLNIDSSSNGESGRQGVRRSQSERKQAVDAEDAAPGSESAAGADSRGSATNGLDKSEQAKENENLEERIEKAVELWQVRSDIARSTFVNNAKLDSEQSVMFDVLVDAMNIRLADSIDRWVETVESKDKIAPEDTLRLVSEATGAIVMTYDEMDRKMPEGWRATQEEPMVMMDFVDPTVAMPLIRIENKLQTAGNDAEVREMRRRGRPGGKVEINVGK